MAGRESGAWLRQVFGLFRQGTIGGLSDGQLLDRFVSRQGNDAEASFEELMHRHGPMVLRVCRRVLRYPQDAEDAFQATFLVLAHRAGSIRRRDSVASWLFGVSQRVAAQARLRAARRRQGERLAAEQTPEACLPSHAGDLREALLEEIDRLPDRLRAAVVLFYLEGLTYEAAALKLGVSEGSVRGRLARARAQLRRRLTRRGVTVPAGVLAVGTIAQGHSQAALSVHLPASLIDSTIRVALGFKTGETATALARGVLKSMLISKLKVVTVVFLAVSAGSLLAWQTLAAWDDNKSQSAPRAESPRAASTPKTEPQADRATGKYALTGSVRVEGTEEPVPGARFKVIFCLTGMNPILEADPEVTRIVETGPDGRFRADLPAGHVVVDLYTLPPGYLKVRGQEGGVFAFSREAPVRRRDYQVRRGASWEFQVRQDSGEPLEGARVYFMNMSPLESFKTETDQSGRALVTLPTEGMKLTGHVSKHNIVRKGKDINLEWESGFQPDKVRYVVRAEGKSSFPAPVPAKNALRVLQPVAEPSVRFGLTDGNGKSATIEASPGIEPAIERGKLVVRLNYSDLKSAEVGELTGQVLDEHGRLVAGALVGLGWGEDIGKGAQWSSPDARHWTTTDPQGRYRIGSIARQGHDGKPLNIQVMVKKEGFAPAYSKQFRFEPVQKGSPQEVAPIRLERGVTLRGTVVDPQGRPVEGALVQPNVHSFASELQFTRTDDRGHFTVRVSKGLIPIVFTYGELGAAKKYLVDGGTEEVLVKVHSANESDAQQPVAAAPPARPKRLAAGQPAPEWQVGAWSDGKPRKLADFKGKVVFLDFWGIWCSACIDALPVLDKLKREFEPRGVVFLSIHTPGENENRIRRVLEFYKVPLLFAIDQDLKGNFDLMDGVTADRYRVRGWPSVFLIDTAGKIAFGPDDPSNGPKVQAVAKAAGIELDPNKITDEQRHRLLYNLFKQDIEAVLSVNH